MSSAFWIVGVLAYGTVAVAVARVLRVLISRSFPDSERWYARAPRGLPALLHGVGGLLWPIALVGLLIWSLLIRRGT